jgi:ligand-binding sensor domain-containing protein
MFATSEAQRKASAKYREKNLDKYAEYKRAFYSKNKDYVEREKKRLKERYALQKEYKAFLNILLE